MPLLKCELTNKEIFVKKICKISEMPKNAEPVRFAFWLNNEPLDIWCTPSMVYYAKTQNKG